VKRTLVVLVVACLATATGCLPARAGARCATTDWGDDGHYVLQCRAGRWRRVMTRQQAAEALAKVIAASRQPAMGEVVRPSTLGTPQLPNTADPAVFVEGGVTYVYATTTYRHLPVVALTDLDAVRTEGEMYSLAHEAMPDKPAWATTTEYWAPSVAKLGGRYLLYFAAHRAGAAAPAYDQCIGKAVASSPLGPFVPDLTPLTCGINGVYGALDPSVFVDPAGGAHLLAAMAGSPTNIWTFPLDGDGNIVGLPTGLVRMVQPWHEWFLENPSMTYDAASGTYLLAYSTGHWDTAGYRTGLARCASPTGPCTDRSDGPWLSSVGDRVGPGGLEFFVGPDGAARVAFHSYRAGDVGPVGKRSTHLVPFHADPWPRIG
jgi:beta-xylosidase